MRILKRPMFRKGGSANSGIMDGLERRNYANSNIADIFKSIGSSRGVHSGTPLEDIPEYEGPKRFQWPEWMKPQKHKITTSSGEEIWTKGGIPIDKQETVPPEAIAGYKIPIPEVKKPLVKKKYDGGLDGVNLEDVKETMSEKNKRYMQMMAPHMQKRMVADALGAASAAFGKGTGNTGQTIANAITAAAAGMGGTKDIYDKVSMLTLQGEIAKDIEKSKVVKKSNYEYLYDKMMSPDPKDKEFAKSILKQDKDLGDFVDQHGTSTGYRLFVGKTMPEIKGTFAGDEKSIKELKTEELGDGKYYLAPPEDTFITIKGGKITKKEPGLV